MNPTLEFLNTVPDRPLWLDTWEWRSAGSGLQSYAMEMSSFNPTAYRSHVVLVDQRVVLWTCGLASDKALELATYAIKVEAAIAQAGKAANETP
jgi:hypothetical protein